MCIFVYNIVEFQSTKDSVEPNAKIGERWPTSKADKFSFCLTGLAVNRWDLFNSFYVLDCILKVLKLHYYLFSTTTQWNRYQHPHFTGRETKV